MDTPCALGIDLHKRFAYWSLVNSQREILWEGKVSTDPEKTKTALAALPTTLSECRAVIEPVDSWGWYAEMLEDLGVKVSLANPLQVSLIAKSRLKYDKVDAKILAELLQTGYLPESYLAPRDTREVRELLRVRIALVSTRTKLKNRIHTVLSKNGLANPVTDLFGKKGLAWLHAQSLRPVYRAEVDSCLRLIAAVNVEMKSLEKDIELRAKHDADTTLLMTMPGVGSFTALLLKAEVGDFTRFPSPESLASFSGLIASSRSSGGKLKYGNITKQGSKYLRWGMVQAAAHVRSSWGPLFQFHERIKTKKGSKVARVALARKMLTIAWYLIKKQEAFSLGNSGGAKR